MKTIASAFLLLLALPVLHAQDTLSHANDALIIERVSSCTKADTLIVIKVGERIAVEQMGMHYETEGFLTEVNDSALRVDDKLIPFAQIRKVGYHSDKRKKSGVALVCVGSAMIVGGGAMIYGATRVGSEGLDNFVEAILLILLGGIVAITGIVEDAIGFAIMHDGGLYRYSINKHRQLRAGH